MGNATMTSSASLSTSTSRVIHGVIGHVLTVGLTGAPVTRRVLR